MSHSFRISDDMIVGTSAIAEFLGPPWNERRVRYARETEALPIRKMRGLGIHAFKSELRTALYAPNNLPGSSITEEADNGEHH